MEDMSPRDPLTSRVIGLAIDVHRELGPGLLESAYEECLCFELRQSGIVFARQVQLPVVYKGVRLDWGYRLDIVVQSAGIVEIKSVDQLLPIPRRATPHLPPLERPQSGFADELQYCRVERWDPSVGSLRIFLGVLSVSVVKASEGLAMGKLR